VRPGTWLPGKPKKRQTGHGKNRKKEGGDSNKPRKNSSAGKGGSLKPPIRGRRSSDDVAPLATGQEQNVKGFTQDRPGKWGGMSDRNNCE